MKGNNKLKILRKFGITFCAAALCCCLSLSAVLPSWQDDTATAGATASSNIKEIDGGKIDSHLEDYLSASTTEKLSDSISDDQILSLIVRSEAQSVLESYNADSAAQNEYTVSEYALTSEGSAVVAGIYKENLSLQARLANAGVQYTLGNNYNVLFGGFEILTRAKYFDQVCDALSGRATVIVGEVYAQCETVTETEIVTNTVNVYDTGIFDSSDCEYDGSGVVIAVLDTGLDYTHSAFSVNNFSSTELALELGDVSAKIGQLTASTSTAGLTAEDVYINAKIPYAYDYADKDSDVFPINSEHGTHVSGIIVGKNDVITGVAPNAQLAFMKVFSDMQDGAKTSWILAALEDCVELGVDVINMSLGSGAGFSREVDEVNVQEIYDSITKQGISLVVAAGNNYSSTYGSAKNGNLSLTSNPDTGVVGSPSSYDAALSVASISGVETPYLTSSVSGDTPIYLTEASGAGAVTKSFVEEVLTSSGTSGDSVTLEYVLVPGVGRSTDYNGVDVKGKIALVKRGSTSFEDKAHIAMEKGAVACIIYNNVSGEISMSVGTTVQSFPVCSISQDDGEMLAAVTGATITVSRSQVAGPFMSNFSSWGPTPSLGIKPEITAHGGDIYSAVPGEAYDRLSGTSMAAPNQAGVTALIRQYVKEQYPTASNTEVTALVNQIMMSTTDIVYNKNGLAYSVRKQGAGLANLTKATSTPAYLRTYDDDGEMDKTKLELGDDPDKTGVYTATFDVVNTGSGALSYDVGAIVITEGISDTLTYKGYTTVTEEGYELSGASVSVSATNGTVSGNTLTVSGGSVAKVTVVITLSQEDKDYLESKIKIGEDANGNDIYQYVFENGMYVEGFITLTAKSGTDIDLSVPYLAFYGDWTQAPLFDLDYFETNKDELNDALDTLDKTLPDAYATKPVGGLYLDYIVYLGSYAFVQDPNATKIAADRKYISLSNQNLGTGSSTVHSISTVYAGMLRSAKYMDITITDSVTGEVIFSKTQYNVRKSYNNGGAGIVPASVDIDFEVTDYNLKNNSQYIVTLKGYLDYGDGGADTNAKNTFEFPFVVDFQAPVLSDVQFRSEYDKDSKSYRVYADLSVYDNHYSQAAIIGRITENTDEDSEYVYSLNSFGNYLTALYSDFNSTTTVTYELTDYLDQIKESYNGNSFIVQLYDYAYNCSTFEVSIPDEIAGITFRQNGEAIDSLDLSLYGTFSLSEILEVSPSESWIPSLNFESSNEDVVRVVNGKLVGVSAGEAVVTAISNANPEITGSITVTVIDDKKYDKTAAESFALTGYTVNKVYYFASSSDRELGTTEAGVSIDFNSSSYTLSMYPSESVTLEYKLSSYFPEDTKVEFVTNNSYVASVSEDGTIVANHEGITMITARVMSKRYDSDGNWTGEYSSTYFSQTVSITVKDPCSLSGFYLLHYYGAGERVEDEETGEISYVITLPDDLGITEIYQYAFTNSKYIAKDEGDVIDKEDPLHSKPTYIGDDMITKVIIPEGVEVIGAYAFAGLTALKEVVLPSTLKKIQYGAFYNCTSLETISFGENNEGENNLQFINNNAFYNCRKLTGISLDSIVAIGDGAFAYNTSLTSLDLPKTAQSIGAQAFFGCTGLTTLRIGADTVKLGAQAFAYCTALTTIAEINASVIPEGLFLGDTSLSSVTIGADVRVINPYAFAGTNVSVFKVSKNGYYTTNQTGSYLLTEDGTLAMVAPTQIRVYDTSITAIGEGALSGNTKITSVYLPNVTAVGNYTFAGCTALTSIVLGTLTQIGDYAFAGTGISAMPKLSSELKSIGSYAFYQTNLTSVEIPDTVETIGSYAFAGCDSVTRITIGNGVVIGDHAFDASTGIMSIIKLTSRGSYDYYGVASQYSTSLQTLTIGDDVEIGEGAFMGAFSSIESIFLDNSVTVAPTVKIGNNVTIGNYAFYSCNLLTELELSNVASIGDYAFSGERWAVYIAPIGSTVTSMDDLTAYGVYMDEMYVGGTLFTYAARLTSIELSAAESVGAYAFAFTYLTDVQLGDKLEVLGEGAFYRTESLAALDLGGVTTIGDYAFYGAEELASVDISGLEYIGKYAFYGTALTGVAFHDGATIGDYAFADTEIVTAENLGSVVVFGASAFAGSALKGTADLTSATVIGEFAFANTGITEVVFGDALESIGENPFAGCLIPAFATKEGETSFTLGESVEVIDGVLYRRTAKGDLELISYPIGREGTIYTVADGTVRIGARAFYQTNLVTVEFVRDVKAIGDRAFYGCSALTVIIYKSIAAPILEEQYDPDYLYMVDEYGIPNLYRRVYGALEVEYTITNEDGSQEIIEVKSLNVVPYKMWNYSNYTNFLYGANFIDLIGEKTLTEHTLIMIRPVNGTGYENFTYSQYFDLVVDGSTAVTDETLAVIAMIEALPEAINITLAHEAAITAALNAYNALTVDQQAIVQGKTGGENYYEKLNSAKNTLDYLKSLEETPSDGGDDGTTEEGSSLTALYVTIGVLAGAVVALVAAIVVIVVLQRMSAKKNTAEAEGGSDAAEDAEETVADAEEPATEEKAQDNGEETDN